MGLIQLVKILHFKRDSFRAHRKGGVVLFGDNFYSWISWLSVIWRTNEGPGVYFARMLW